ncbi:hypothetical protein TPHA_0L00320 [Tetrapisispora phaffii CBS 4417]|uniref:alpha-1,2-Mannosidase n=1 Tax=Tetrapisispora phaffii (strain ATCC 24235 / CBS 4417 / NBRC 1672 / NRRL Y-8282 / UCD 70-5) TaxID=1071381 RepID=G8BZR0_TETPH|nr:hypothetical protein TPHA_0L00320 [Tetrapisispora phaffii CBS 4417]CCE65388.1 hypothetical protein TPHA_0L00320 [Tetrapisispora phaffii CBS 4417]
MFKPAVFIVAIALAVSYWVTKEDLAKVFEQARTGMQGSRAFRNRHKSSVTTRQAIEQVFLASWDDYVEHGWGYDVYGPISERGQNMARSKEPLGWIIVDTVDTLMLMYNQTTEHKEKFARAIIQAEQWIEQELSYDIDSEVSVFETTIRMLGGLLAAHHLSMQLDVGNPEVYLQKAVDLGDRLAMAFVNSETGIPYSSVNLKTGQTVKNHVDDGASSTAEFTTLQLEFKYLSFLTGNNSYWLLAENVYPTMYKKNNLTDEYYSGLVPIYTHPDTGMFHGQNIRMGSRGDSFYEYLLKQYLMTSEELYYDLYRISMDGMKKKLLAKSHPHGLTYIGERPFGPNKALIPKLDHLVCFMGGLLAMGATNGLQFDEARKSSFWDAKRADDFKIAEELTYSCFQLYDQIPSGLAPEIVMFNDNSEGLNNEAQRSKWWGSPSGDYFVKPLDKHNLQRPETVESIMFLYHLTKDEKYRDMGRKILDSFIENSKYVDPKTGKTKYVSLDNCVDMPTKKRDNMESFWLAETLKYLYLLFEDDVELDKMVFNTEAHPFPVLDSETLGRMQLKTGWLL